MSQNTLKLINDSKAKWVSLRFTDTQGQEKHVTVPAERFDESTMEDGCMFDGSSIAGWKSINESDMVLKPDDDTAVMDPFTEELTVQVRCNVIEPDTNEAYACDPRSIAQRAEEAASKVGLADKVYMGPEPEFFIFDEVKWSNQISRSMFDIKCESGIWSSDKDFELGNTGHRPGIKGGYFAPSPIDLATDLRNAMCAAMVEMGLEIEIHHGEVATGCQNEIGVRFNTLLKKADEVQIYKYCVRNVAHAHGKTATFMPKPLIGDNGSGMHIHQSLEKNGENIFYDGSRDLNLSQEAMWYAGGIIKHAKAINAIANPTTNSYKRLVPGFEAPILLTVSGKNRSASIRIPHVPNKNNKKACRIETRFPDPTGNPYLTFAAMLQAGIDGIKNKIDPGECMDVDLFSLPTAEQRKIPRVCSNLKEALEALDSDREFLLANKVFSNEAIDSYIELKYQEYNFVEYSTNPAEFELYYSR